MSMTLAHRGAHDVGMVAGLTGDTVYVPRAGWTESFDSPLKTRTIDGAARQHADEQLRNQQRQGTMRQYLTQELGKQVQHSATAKHSVLGQTKDLALGTAADAQRLLQSQTLERAAKEESKRVLRASLDEMRGEAQRRERENQARLLHEAAEVKLRTLQQLSEEVAEQSRRKEVAQRDAREAVQQWQARKQQQRKDKEREDSEARRLLQEQTLEAEHQLAAQQERLRAAQAKQDASYKTFRDTAMRAEASQRAAEEGRREHDEAAHQMLSDMHYARREAAREKQRQRMVEALDQQVEGRKRSRSLVAALKQSELEAVNESTKKSFERDLQTFHRKRREELQHQSDLVAMMAEKQQRAKSEGSRAPPAAATMAVTPAMLADAKLRAAPGARKSSSTPDLHQRVDASRYLLKPCGRPEMKPWIDISKSHGVGGVVGVFGGDGSTRMALAATGGQGRLLTKTAALAARDRQMASCWHEGLTAADMRAGRQAAARRGANAAAESAVAP